MSSPIKLCAEENRTIANVLNERIAVVGDPFLRLPSAVRRGQELRMLIRQPE
jgi:hypothetical protein